MLVLNQQIHDPYFMTYSLYVYLFPYFKYMEREDVSMNRDKQQ